MTATSFDNVAADARANYKRGWSLPAYHFQSPECYSHDLGKMREQMWWLAGHESQLVNPGDYLLFRFAQESIILVRDKSGAVNAFYNVCRHRGLRLCREEHGNVRMFSCMYHGWTYKLDGTLLPPRSMPSDFEAKDYGLERCHIRSLDGMLFVNLALGTPPDFEEFANRLRPFLKPYNISRTKLVAEEHHPSTSNWKVSIENFAECYHCKGVHPAMCRISPPPTGEAEVPDANGETFSMRMERLGRLVYPLYDDGSSPHFQQAFQIDFRAGAVSFTMNGERASKLIEGITEWSGSWTLISFNPFIHAFLFDDYVHFLSYVPIDADTTDGHMYWLVDKDAVEGVDYDRTTLTALSSKVMQEDVVITDEVQAGIASSAYHPAPLSIEEERVLMFHDWYFTHFAPDNAAGTERVEYAETADAS